MSVSLRSLTAWLGLALLASSCKGAAGKDGAGGADGAGSLVRVLAEPPGAHCPTGGQAIQVGLDANRNGVLDAPEATATSYVCNGLSSLAEVADEPAGVHCPAGGQLFRVGQDANGNGALDGAEVARTTYVCNGTDGAAASAGLTSLVVTAPELPGSHCPAGGVAIATGLDRDRSGTLDAGEVSSTRHVCDGAAGAGGTNGLTTLLATTLLPAGDTHCPAGGVALTRGLDANRNGQLDFGEIAGTDHVCNGAAGKNGLVATQAEPAGTNCTTGGTAILSGSDQNGDGVLQPGEVTSTTYVCSGAAGAAALVALADEPAGAHCASGGKAVSSGPDRNGNGLLDPGEVTATSWVCNGANGSNGADGFTSLVSVLAEPAGASCPAGGQKVLTGVDRNRNGVLDATEIANTAYLCSGANRLYRVSSALWGGVCARGGVRMETGIDANGNGALDDAEVEAARTQYLCNLYYAQVAAGNSHSCGLVSDGTVRCWGGNVAGQLGDGTTVDRSTPVRVAGLSGATAVVAGMHHSCALVALNSVRCWGGNASGQLGDGTTTQRLAPAASLTTGRVLTLSAGGSSTCATELPTSGGLARFAECWGRNQSGQLGDGSTTDRATPVRVSGLTGPGAIAINDGHACAVVLGGVSCWGANGSGQLGDGTTTQRLAPVAVSGLGPAASLDVGWLHTCAVLTGGGVSCWGYNGLGGLGDGSATQRLTPVAAAGITLATAVATGSYGSCAIDGAAVKCWGAVPVGPGCTTLTSCATPTAAGVRAQSGSGLALREAHACALAADGQALCWGRNDSGQLGDGTLLQRTAPVPVQDPGLGL